MGESARRGRSIKLGMFTEILRLTCVSHRIRSENGHSLEMGYGVVAEFSMID